jgi:hypothetical protein
VSTLQSIANFNKLSASGDLPIALASFTIPQKQTNANRHKNSLLIASIALYVTKGLKACLFKLNSVEIVFWYGNKQTSIHSNHAKIYFFLLPVMPDEYGW